MRAILSFLSLDEIEQIHEASLRILRETGVKIHSEKVRKLLTENGAQLNGNIVKIPDTLVNEAIDKAPKEMTLCDRDPDCDLKLPAKDFRFLSTSGFSPFITTNPQTGERRQATSSDLKDIAILGDYLDAVDYFFPSVIPNDLPPLLQELHALAIALRNNRKHILCCCMAEKTARWQIRLASVIAGGEEELRKRPIFSTIFSPVSPLTFEKEAAEAMPVLAKAEIPIVPMNMVLGAATAPATLAGTLTVGNAEMLASLVIVECANSGAPMIYALQAVPANMKTGEINHAAPQHLLLSAGCAQMARFYRLPSLVADIWLERAPLELSALERNVLKAAMWLMCGSDISPSLGCRDLAMSISLEQVILDAEACQHARAYLRRFETDDDTLAVDVVHEVGPGGHFLDKKHTLEHFRREIWSRELSDTIILDPNVKGSFLERAQAKVKEILAEHTAPTLNENVRREMEQIISDAEKDIVG